MTVIKCPDCGYEVSEQAQFCPNCGRPVQTPPFAGQPPPPQPQKSNTCLIVGLVVGGVGLFFIMIVGILALIAIPNFVSLRAKAYNNSAVSAGYNAKIAQELYYQESGGDFGGGRYTCSLDELLKWDPNLTDDTLVTFIFSECNQSGYTYTTTHAKGDMTHLVTD